MKEIRLPTKLEESWVIYVAELWLRLEGMRKNRYREGRMQRLQGYGY